MKEKIKFKFNKVLFILHYCYFIITGIFLGFIEIIILTYVIYYFSNSM